MNSYERGSHVRLILIDFQHLVEALDEYAALRPGRFQELQHLVDEVREDLELGIRYDDPPTRGKL